MIPQRRRLRLAIVDKTQDAVRFTRLPNSRRNDDKVTNSRQRLLAVNVGAESFEAWESTLEIESDLPEIKTPEQIDANGVPADPPLIHGVLRERSKMALSSGSKGRKTWMLIAMGLCVASGKEWLGFKCEPGKVLYLNFELKESVFNYRVDRIRRALGIGQHQRN